MNHAPLNITKRTLTLMAVAAACPFAQAGTDGYLSTSSAAGTSAVGPTAVYSGDAQNNINDREKARRQAQMDEALQLLQEGRTAYDAKKYKLALEKFQAAWSRIPKAPATVKWQEHIIDCIGDASIAVSMEYAKIGRYDEAEQLLLDVLSRDPKNRLAKRRLEELRDPIRNNPALTPEHVKNVEEVQRLLTLGYGYYNLGDFDAAYDTFNRVLKVDPYNSAARRGQEAVSKRKQTYYQSARDAFRAQALAQVDAIWQEALPQDTPDIELGGVSVAEPISPQQLRNNEQLMGMRISSVQLIDVPMADALELMRAEARKNNLNLNFIYEKPKAAPVPQTVSSDEDEDYVDDEESEDESVEPAPLAPVATDPVISELKVQDISGKDLLEMMCNLSGCQYRVEDNGIVVYPTGSSEKMFRRQWKVARGFFSEGDGEDDYGDDYEDEDGGFATRTSKRIDAKATLQNAGVDFRDNAYAKYSTSTGMLTVYNTPDNLDAVEEAISAYRRQMPQMVKVSTKFIEVSQTNEEELSFDWVVNPFSINNSGSTYIGGVNGQGSTPNRTPADFVGNGGTSFGNNYNGNGSWPIGGTTGITDSNSPITNGLVTGGNRSGSGAVSANRLDSLLSAGSREAASTAAPAPGILSLTGIFDSGSYQMIMRGLSQKKGVDIMSAPSLVARPGELDFTPEPDPLASDQNGDNGCAKIEMVRRFIYASAYEAPEIDAGGNNNWNNDNNNNNWGGGGGMPIASPANPSEWAVEEVGIVMRFKVAELGADSDIIQFDQFEIKVVDFEGFINYGSPITAGITNANTIEHITLTENRIDMPVFSRRYINSNPCIYDGYTIAVGGMIEDSVQKVEDSVPVFGDLPLIGRFFRSNAESHIRKNMIVFVTAEKIDPTGKPTRLRDKGTGDNPATAEAPSLFADDGLVNP